VLIAQQSYSINRKTDPNFS